MSDVAELVAWLRREIEADKAAALAAVAPPWNVFIAGSLMSGAPPNDEEFCAVFGEEFEPDDATARHIARHDPQDVIADADAKLAILDEHDDDSGQCGTCGNYDPTGLHHGGAPYPCRTVRLLAQGYRHRDGWQASWEA